MGLFSDLKENVEQVWEDDGKASSWAEGLY